LSQVELNSTSPCAAAAWY